MKKQILLLISLFVLILGCNSPDNQALTEEINSVGLKEKFILKGFNAGVEIYLRPDFSFINKCYSYGCLGGYRIKLVLGEYTLKGNKINFKPQKLVWKEDWEGRHWDSNIKHDTISYYDSDTTRIQNNYWLIESDNFKFLISESQLYQQDEYFYKSSNFISLSNLYNSNINQEANENVLSNTDTVCNFRHLNLKNEVPKAFKYHFLKEPIEIEVLKVKVIKRNECLIPQYTLNLKRKENLKKGMKLYSRKYPDHPVTVTEIGNDYCIGEGFDLFYENTKLKIGTKLNTESNNG